MPPPADPARPSGSTDGTRRVHSRTYEWVATGDLAEGEEGTTGLERLEAIRDERTPGAPLMYTIGWTLTHVAAGEVELRLHPEPFHMNPYRIHGGVLTTLLDSATACAVISTLAVGETSTTLGINTHFLRSVYPDTGEIVCRGRVVQRGRRVATSEATIVDGSEREVARATATSLIIAPATAPPTDKARR